MGAGLFVSLGQEDYADLRIGLEDDLQPDMRGVIYVKTIDFPVLADICSAIHHKSSHFTTFFV